MEVKDGYGTQLLKQLSKVLTAEYGKGFSVQTLYRQFYITFPNIFPTAWGISSEKFSMPWGILTWSHYKRLLSVSNEAARNWYLREASEQMWSYALDAEIVKVADYELEPAYA